MLKMDGLHHFHSMKLLKPIGKQLVLLIVQINYKLVL